MRPFIAAVLVTGAALSATPASAQSAGTYAIEGWCGSQPHYRGTLTLAGRGPVYDVTWLVGRDVFRGRAIEQDGAIAISFTQNGVQGVMNARRSGYQWLGVWTLGNDGGACVENWVLRR